MAECLRVNDEASTRTLLAKNSFLKISSTTLPFLTEKEIGVRGHIKADDYRVCVRVFKNNEDRDVYYNLVISSFNELSKQYKETQEYYEF